MELPPPLVLLVDDVRENLEMLYRILGEQKYRFALASNAAETYRAVEKEIPDIILLDVMLPDGNGFSIAQELRRKYPDKEFTVIFITARADIEDKIKGFSAGAVDYIPKPFHNREVLLRVQTHVELLLARKRQAVLIDKLQTALEEVRNLRGIIPICAHCKKVRDDSGYWQNVEQYFRRYNKIEFSHGLCPECLDKLYPEYSEENDG
ncbi:MAG: two-component system response regulator, partial [Spirochaetaceae bacterium]